MLPHPTDETKCMSAEALRYSVQCDGSKELNTAQNTVAVVTCLRLVHIHVQDYISFSLQIINQSADTPAICHEYIQQVVNTVTCSYRNKITVPNSL